MDSSDEEMLLGSCCFLLNFHQQWKIFKKRKEHGVYHNLFKGMRVNDRESHFRENDR